MNSQALLYPNQQIELRLLARACARAGLTTAFGHCSLRLGADDFLVCAPHPIGLISPEDAGTIVSLEGELPDGVLGEVRMHREVSILEDLPAHFLHQYANRLKGVRPCRTRAQLLQRRRRPSFRTASCCAPGSNP